jgi:hypothetical protein
VTAYKSLGQKRTIAIRRSKSGRTSRKVPAAFCLKDGEPAFVNKFSRKYRNAKTKESKLLRAKK